SVESGPAPRGETSGQAPGGRGAAQGAEETLAAGADEQRTPQRPQLVEAAQQLEVLRRGLAESDAGVENGARLGDAALGGAAETQGELAPHVGQELLEANLLLHARQLAAAVHQDDRRDARRENLRHVRISERRDVVDEIGAGGEGLAGDDGLAGV